MSDINEQDISWLKDVIYQSEGLCTQAIDEDYRAIQFVKDKSLPICIYALLKDKRSIEYIPKEKADKILNTLEEYKNNYLVH